MRVKICGITSQKDAMMAIDAGADALGFVFYPPSPRYITPKEARVIIDKLPPFVEKVGLFVNEDAKAINAMSQEANTTLAQLHFEVENTLTDQLKVPFIRVIRAQSLKDVLLHRDEYRLIDAYCEAYGGVGKRLNLEWFEGVDCSNIILAGGLTPENVEETKPFGFYALDVSSGVEASKGVKETQKVNTFIRRAKS
ncbi:MAG: phosphoribosylanthranilate isomerase [Epsilonproteobacteria bacterium]|nr:MAG: phosphoribosylanthranilate isomerase [Campylobacterota bacterium]